jgi:hypothetical protein
LAHLKLLTQQRHIPADLNTQHYNSGTSLTFVQLRRKQ